ncbi:MAG TPA: hypothetical protein VD931_12510 [Baekduia sp.]|nr:hypothetical protein [Baekduia sp.]
MDPVIIYSSGIIYTSACADAALTVEEVAAVVNDRSPTGISSPWRLAEAPTFVGGEPNPCPCEQHPDTRRHWLLAC